MDTEREIQRAIELGEENREIIRLARNWCSHIDTSLMGGTGLVEQQTGLPIGARSFTCPFSKSNGLAGMKLETVILDFHDRNCVNCDRREPVALPNISELVGNRDRIRAREDRDRIEFESQLAQQLEKRRLRRESALPDLTARQVGIVELLDDVDCRAENADTRLEESAKADPAAFDENIQDLLFELADAGRGTSACLQVLDLIGADSRRLSSASISALASYKSVSAAARIFEKLVRPSDAESIPDALPALFSIASGQDWLPGPFSAEGPKLQLGAILRAHELFPEATTAYLRRSLRSREATERAIACDVAIVLLGNDSSIVVSHLNDFIAAATLPVNDTSWNINPRHRVSRALGASFSVSPEVTAEAIDTAFPTPTDNDASLLIEAFGFVLHEDADSLPPSPAASMAFQSLLRQVCQPLGDSAGRAAQSAISVYSGERTIRLAAENATAILGTAALLLSNVDAGQESALDARPHEARTLDEYTRRLSLSSMCDALLTLLAEALRRYPGMGLDVLLDFTSALGDDQEDLFARIIRIFDKLISGAESMGKIIPHLYSAMMSPSLRLRGEAAIAYGKISAISGMDLPPLLQCSFELTLSDAYVYVHKSAVDALSGARLSGSHRSNVRARLWRLILAYAGDRSEDELLSACLQRLIELSQEDEINDQFSAAIFTLLTRMTPLNAADVLTHRGRRLPDSAVRLSLLAKISKDPQCHQRFGDELIELMQSSPASLWRECAPDIVDAGRHWIQFGRGATSQLIEPLTEAGCWREATELAELQLSELPNTVAATPNRLRGEAVRLAIQIESVCHDRTDPSELLHRWVTLQEEITRDDEENSEERDPLRGFLSPR